MDRIIEQFNKIRNRELEQNQQLEFKTICKKLIAQMKNNRASFTKDGEIMIMEELNNILKKLDKSKGEYEL